MQIPAVAVFGAANVAVGVLPPEAAYEMTRNIYYLFHSLQIYSSVKRQRRIQDLIGEGLQVLRAPF